MGNVPPSLHTQPVALASPIPRSHMPATKGSPGDSHRILSPPPSPHLYDGEGSDRGQDKTGLLERATSQLVTTPPPSDDENSRNGDSDRDRDYAGSGSAVRRYDDRSQGEGSKRNAVELVRDRRGEEVSSILKDHSALNTSVVVQDFSSADGASERLSFGDHSRDDDDAMAHRGTPDIDYTQSALQREASRLRVAREAEVAARAAAAATAESTSLESGDVDMLLSPRKEEEDVAASPKSDNGLGESTGSLWRMASKRKTDILPVTTTSTEGNTLSDAGSDDEEPAHLADSSRQNAFNMKSLRSPRGNDEGAQLVSATQRAQVRLTSSSKVIRVKSGEFSDDMRDHKETSDYRRDESSQQATSFQSQKSGAPGTPAAKAEGRGKVSKTSDHHSIDSDRAAADHTDSIVVLANEDTLAHISDDSSRIDELSEHNTDTPLRESARKPSGYSTETKRSNDGTITAAVSNTGTLERTARKSRRSISDDDESHDLRREVENDEDAHITHTSTDLFDGLHRIGEEQKYRLLTAAYPELAVKQPHPAAGGIYKPTSGGSSEHPHEYIHDRHLPGFSQAASVQSGQGMEHMLHRIRLLEAESKARREQQAEDEDRLRRCEGEWVAEITALRVQLGDMEIRLEEERKKSRKALHEVAVRESEVQSLRGKLRAAHGCFATVHISTF